MKALILFGIVLVCLSAAVTANDYDTFTRGDNASIGVTEGESAVWNVEQITNITNNALLLVAGGIEDPYAYIDISTIYDSTAVTVYAEATIGNVGDSSGVWIWSDSGVGGDVCAFICSSGTIVTSPDGNPTGELCNESHEMRIFANDTTCSFDIDSNFISTEDILNPPVANFGFYVANSGTMIVDSMAVCSGENWTCAPPLSCVEDWIPQYSYTSCLNFLYNKTVTYTDNNACGTIDNLPVDNGTTTFIACGCGITPEVSMYDYFDDSYSSNPTWQPYNHSGEYVWEVQDGKLIENSSATSSLISTVVDFDSSDEYYFRINGSFKTNNYWDSIVTFYLGNASYINSQYCMSGDNYDFEFIGITMAFNGGSNYIRFRDWYNNELDEATFNSIATNLGCGSSHNTWFNFSIERNTSGSINFYCINATSGNWVDYYLFDETEVLTSNFEVFFINTEQFCRTDTSSYAANTPEFNYVNLMSVPVENWQPLYAPGSCLINDTYNTLKTYNDTHSCGSVNDLPVDNGTVSPAACNYCSADIVTLYTDWSVCADQSQSRVEYFTDNNYATCCETTTIPSDCIVDTYTNNTLNRLCNSVNEVVTAASVPANVTTTIPAPTGLAVELLSSVGYTGNVTVAEFTTIPAAIQALFSIGAVERYVDITFDEAVDVEELTVSITYTDGEIAGLVEESLRLYYFNETANEWQLVDSSVNTLTNTVTGTTSHASLYGIGGLPFSEYESIRPQLIYVLTAFGVMAVILGAIFVVTFVVKGGDFNLTEIAGVVIALAIGFSVLAALLVVIVRLFVG